MEPKPIVKLPNFRHPTDEQLPLLDHFKLFYTQQQLFAVCSLRIVWMSALHFIAFVFMLIHT